MASSGIIECECKHTGLSARSGRLRFSVHKRLYPGWFKQELGRRGGTDETHVDDHRGRRRPEQLRMVPGAVRSESYPSCPRLLWANPRFRWDCLALPPQMGRPRASLIDEPGSRNTRQRPPVVLPCRRFRPGASKGTLSRQSARRGANSNTQTQEFSLRDPDGYYVTISALS